MQSVCENLLCAAWGSHPDQVHCQSWPRFRLSGRCWSPQLTCLSWYSVSHWLAIWMWWGLLLCRRCTSSQLNRAGEGGKHNELISSLQQGPHPKSKYRLRTKTTMHVKLINAGAGKMFITYSWKSNRWLQVKCHKNIHGYCTKSNNN